MIESISIAMYVFYIYRHLLVSTHKLFPLEGGQGIPPQSRKTKNPTFRFHTVFGIFPNFFCFRAVLLANLSTPSGKPWSPAPMEKHCKTLSEQRMTIYSMHNQLGDFPFLLEFTISVTCSHKFFELRSSVHSFWYINIVTD